jgi:nitrile hydratase
LDEAARRFSLIILEQDCNLFIADQGSGRYLARELKSHNDGKPYDFSTEDPRFAQSADRRGMNGPHDIGGQTSFGPILQEENEPVFHAKWERRVLAMSVASASMLGSLDRRRHALEKLDRDTYLSSSYYERWLARLEILSLAGTWLTKDELASGIAERFLRTTPAISADEMEAIVRAGRPSARDFGVLDTVFKVGQRIRTNNLESNQHTRLPRYARGKAGVIVRLHGTHCFPDTNAHGLGENPQPLYSVAFNATELWGASASDRDLVHLDLWQSYLKCVEN